MCFCQVEFFLVKLIWIVRTQVKPAVLSKSCTEYDWIGSFLLYESADMPMNPF
jgi:hypothetical protein